MMEMSAPVAPTEGQDKSETGEADRPDSDDKAEKKEGAAASDMPEMPRMAPYRYEESLAYYAVQKAEEREVRPCHAIYAVYRKISA